MHRFAVSLTLFTVVELSCKSEYALLAMFALAQNYSSGEPLQIKSIATQQGIPERYLEQLLASLRRQGLVRSQRGAKGGYLLGREPWAIQLFEIVEAIEGGESSKQRNGSGKVETIEQVILQDTWKEVRVAANAVLQKYTLHDLCDLRTQRQRANVMYYI